MPKLYLENNPKHSVAIEYKVDVRAIAASITRSFSPIRQLNGEVGEFYAGMLHLAQEQ
jgi:hypothetical protein